MTKLFTGLLAAAMLLSAVMAFAIEPVGSVPSATCGVKLTIESTCYVETYDEDGFNLLVADTTDNLAALRAGTGSASDTVSFAYGSNFADAQLTASYSVPTASNSQSLPGAWSLAFGSSPQPVDWTNGNATPCTAPGESNIDVTLAVESLSLNDIHNEWNGLLTLTISEL